MEVVGIVSHLEKSQVPAIAQELIEWLEARNIRVRLPLEDAKALKRTNLGCDEEGFRKDSELVIVLGGDGTILRAARLLQGEEIPILGVNLGKFGFLSQIEVADLHTTLAKVLDGKMSIQKRMMLEGKFWRGNEILSHHKALNEIVIGRGSSQRLVRLDVYVNSRPFITYAADSLIFATPTGSTAYSLSACGPIVAPELRLILMTPVCPHTFFNRTLIFSPRDEIRVIPHPPREKICMSIDGRLVEDSASFDALSVLVSESSLSLVKLEGADFFSLVKTKLGLGEAAL